MGSKIAPAKSFNFATCEKARLWLERTRWKAINDGIPVLADFRYLGSHANTSTRRKYGTADDRCDRGIEQLGRLKRLPVPLQEKWKS